MAQSNQYPRGRVAAGDAANRRSFFSNQPEITDLIFEILSIWETRLFRKKVCSRSHSANNEESNDIHRPARVRAPFAPNPPYRTHHWAERLTPVYHPEIAVSRQAFPCTPITLIGAYPAMDSRPHTAVRASKAESSAPIL